MSSEAWTLVGVLFGGFGAAALSGLWQTRMERIAAWRAGHSELVTARRQVYARFLLDVDEYIHAHHRKAWFELQNDGARATEAELQAMEANTRVNASLGEIELITPAPGTTHRVAVHYTHEVFDLVDRGHSIVDPDDPQVAERLRRLQEFIDHARADINVGPMWHAASGNGWWASMLEWWSMRPAFARARVRRTGP